MDLYRSCHAYVYPSRGDSFGMTLLEAIGDLEETKEGEISNHFWSKAKYFPGTQGNSFVSKDKIGPTMRAEHHGNIEFHWNKKRRFKSFLVSFSNQVSGGASITADTINNFKKF